MKKFLFLPLVLGILASCAKNDLCVTYMGILPTEGGQGVSTELTLNPDGTYTMNTTYIGQGAEVYVDEGTYQIKDDVLSLNSKQSELTYFQMEEGQIRRLDKRQNQIIGQYSEAYVLKENDVCQKPKPKVDLTW